MVYDIYLGSGDSGIIPINGNWDHTIDIEREGIQIMQYIGLKDRDGKEIYEGDIVEYGDEPVRHIINSPEWFRVDAFDVYGYKGLDCFAEIKTDNYETPTGLRFLSSCKVIGNIYQNPELIKESHEYR